MQIELIRGVGDFRLTIGRLTIDAQPELTPRRAGEPWAWIERTTQGRRGRIGHTEFYLDWRR